MVDVKVLNIDFSFEGIKDTVHPVLICMKQEIILVDCGYLGFLSKLENEIQAVGVDCNQITKVVITHHDHDHMGALAEFREKYPKIKVVASELEAPYISGKEKFLRLSQAEEFQKYLPDEQKKFGENFCNILRRVRTTNVDITVRDGDCIDKNRECEVIATPGHTPGHISIYLKNIRTMITGDAAVLEDNELIIANPQFALDIRQAEQSVEKILTYDAETFICYHGGIFKK